jgi:hypothetical protein
LQAFTSELSSQFLISPLLTPAFSFLHLVSDHFEML